MRKKWHRRSLRIRDGLFGLVFAILFFLVGCGGSNDSFSSYLGLPITHDSMDEHLESKLEEMDIPGLAMAVVADGEVVYHFTGGYADKAQQVKVDDATIFEGASMSKSLFAQFAMTFVEEGKLELDRPLHEYLPYPAIEHDERYQKITARMALSHRTGFPNWRWDRDDERLVIEFDPGTSYQYSGEGYQYLAEVLRHLADTDWEGLDALFIERIAAPLGMTHTRFIPDEYAWEHKAEPYDEDGNWIDWPNHADHIRNDGVFVAAASIHSEPLDFSKWMIGVMNKERLTPESYAELLRPHSATGLDGPFDIDYTLGFFRPQIPLTDLYLHGGNNHGFTCGYVLDMGRKWGFVVFTNSEYGEQLAQELLSTLLLGPDGGKYLWAGGIVATLAAIMLLWVGYRFIGRFLRRRREGTAAEGV